MANKGDPPNPKSKQQQQQQQQQQARRRIAVEGEAPAIELPKKPKQRSLREILGDPAKGAEEGPTPEGPVWDPRMLEAFLRGRITLGDLEGITKQEQYEMANIGFSYLTSGKLDQAKTVFEGLVALDPYDAYFHTALGSIAQQKNDLAEAEARYSRALEINPFSPVALANRGEVRVLVGRLAEGAADLVRALEEDPNGVQPSTQRARATIQVVRDQLEQLNLGHITGSKVPAATAANTGSKVAAAGTGLGAGTKATVASASAPIAGSRNTGDTKKPAIAAPPANVVSPPSAAARKTGEVKKPGAAASGASPGSSSGSSAPAASPEAVAATPASAARKTAELKPPSSAAPRGPNRRARPSAQGPRSNPPPKKK